MIRRANVEYSGAEALDFLTPEGKIPHLIAPFKGNMDTEALEAYILKRGAENIPMCVMTITNNSGGGSRFRLGTCGRPRPSAVNMASAFHRCLPLCRERLVHQDPGGGYKDKTVEEIAREIFALADGCTMSAKKDALVNIGVSWP